MSPALCCRCYCVAVLEGALGGGAAAPDDADRSIRLLSLPPLTFHSDRPTDAGSRGKAQPPTTLRGASSNPVHAPQPKNMQSSLWLNMSHCQMRASGRVLRRCLCKVAKLNIHLAPAHEPSGGVSKPCLSVFYPEGSPYRTCALVQGGTMCPPTRSKQIHLLCSLF